LKREKEENRQQKKREGILKEEKECYQKEKCCERGPDI
jgi:hypothetical protein